MKVTRGLVKVGFIAAGVIGTVAVTAPETRVGRAARRVSRRLARDVRYAASSTPGLVYRLRGRQPDPNAPDDVIADRIRSTLGPLEKRLDVPRIHVMVNDHVAIIHGDVTDERDAYAIEQAVLCVSGVDNVESHLHVGLARGDTLPSEGKRAPRPPSDALRALLDAAMRAGATDAHSAVHAVLCRFFDRIPEDERSQVFAHLPDDVLGIVGPPRRLPGQAARLRAVPQLVAAVTAEGGIEPDRAEAVTRAVVGALHEIVPEEANDVAAVLPAELRKLWMAQPAL